MHRGGLVNNGAYAMSLDDTPHEERYTGNWRNNCLYGEQMTTEEEWSVIISLLSTDMFNLHLVYWEPYRWQRNKPEEEEA